MRVVRLSQINSEQTVELVRETELLSKLNDEHIVKVKAIKNTSFIFFIYII